MSIRNIRRRNDANNHPKLIFIVRIKRANNFCPSSSKFKRILFAPISNLFWNLNYYLPAKAIFGIVTLHPIRVIELFTTQYHFYQKRHKNQQFGGSADHYSNRVLGCSCTKQQTAKITYWILQQSRQVVINMLPSSKYWRVQLTKLVIAWDDQQQKLRR